MWTLSIVSSWSPLGKRKATVFRSDLSRSVHATHVTPHQGLFALACGHNCGEICSSGYKTVRSTKRTTKVNFTRAYSASLLLTTVRKFTTPHWIDVSSPIHVKKKYDRQWQTDLTWPVLLARSCRSENSMQIRTFRELSHSTLVKGYW